MGAALDVHILREAMARYLEALEAHREEIDSLNVFPVPDGDTGTNMLLTQRSVVEALGGADGSLLDLGRAAAPASRYGFEVMYLLEAFAGEVGGLRARLSEVGDSVVVVGGGGMYSVHVHTDEPGAAVEAGVERGRPSAIRIALLDEAVAGRCLAGPARATRVPEEAASEGGPAATGGSVVAVVEGDGLTEIFGSLGASVVPGGPGHNPPVSDLLEAVARAPGEVVFLLPNHRNVFPAAEAAGLEVEVHRGGQPAYPYLIGVE